MKVLEMTKLPASNIKKVLVHFKFKDDNTEYQKWLTYKQYMNLSLVECIEFCKILPLEENANDSNDIKLKMKRPTMKAEET